MVFVIVEGETGKKHRRNDPYSVYECLAFDMGVEEEEAIEASSWCELACAGDEYDGGGFTIEA